VKLKKKQRFSMHDIVGGMDGGEDMPLIRGVVDKEKNMN
jgi:hypothetical protein